MSTTYSGMSSPWSLSTASRFIALFLTCGVATAIGNSILRSSSEVQQELGIGSASTQGLELAFGGQTVEVTGDAGLRVVRSLSVEAVALMVSGVDESQPLMLTTCDASGQVRGRGRLVARLVQSLRPNGPESSKAVVIGSSWGAGMPDLEVVAGAAEANSGGATALQVRTVNDQGHGTITLGDGFERGFGSEAWVLWSPVANEESRYRSALRLRTVRSKDRCVSGTLEVRAYRVRQDTPAEGVSELTGPSGAQPTVKTIVLQRGQATRSLWLPLGQHRVPLPTPVVKEDRRLFEDSVEQGLIFANPQGAIDIVPLGAFSHVQGAGPDPYKAALLRRLHSRADGHYVRSAIDQFNNSRLEAAIRLLHAPDQWPGLGMSVTDWSVEVDAVGVWGQFGLPEHSVKLAEYVPVGAGDWFRVAKWPTAASGSSSVRFVLRLPTAARGGEVLTLMVLGGRMRTEAADERVGACESSRTCVGRGDQGEVAVSLKEGQTSVEVVLQPAELIPRSHSAAGGEVSITLGRPTWSDSNAGSPWMQVGQQLKGHRIGAQGHFNRVTVRAAGGEVLSVAGEPSALATSIGLAPLVGLGTEHRSGVSGVVAAHLKQSVDASLTIDALLQRISDESLDCVGHRGMRPGQHARGATCADAERIPALRRSAIVLLDADRGDILAAASRPGPLPSSRVKDLVNFDRYRPSLSSLQWSPWQHDGGAFWAPGSTFKVVDALAFEAKAATSPALSALLEGSRLNLPTVAASGARPRFDPDSGCYPSPCSGSRAQVHNFKGAKPRDFMRNGQFGLETALTHSVNTWFSWLAEETDGLVQRGLPGVRLLRAEEHMDLRPTLAVAEKLGFGTPLRLDGGLLRSSQASGEDLGVLVAHASQVDPVDTAADVRRLALGLRMQATPLQMARVAAAVATGSVVTPRLMSAVNEEVSRPSKLALPIRTDRIRRAMGTVVSSGTAAGAFAHLAHRDGRQQIFGKTGTAPHADGVHNNAWFIGWLEPHTIPGEARRIAFAVMVSHTEQGQTGGSRAAAVIAELVRTARAELDAAKIR